jgi:hypothetical protein
MSPDIGILIAIIALAVVIGSAIIFFVISLFSRFNNLVATLPAELIWSGTVVAWGLYFIFLRYDMPANADIAMICGFAGLALFMLSIIITYTIIIRYNYNKGNLSSVYRYPGTISNPDSYLACRYGIPKPNPKGYVTLRTRAEMNYYAANPLASTEREAERLNKK